MNIDFKKFKKMECDDNCTTLQHPSGHLIKIAHKGLKPEHREELEKLPIHMASGGKLKDQKGAYRYKEAFAGSQASKPAASSNTMPGSPTEAKHAYTEPGDQGSVQAGFNRTSPPFGPLGDEPQQKMPPCINPSCKSYGHPHPNCRCYGGTEQLWGFSEGGEVEYYCDDNRAHKKACEYYKDGGEVKGVHKPYYDDNSGGESKAGDMVRSMDLHKGNKQKAIDEHHKVYGEMKAMPKPKIQNFKDAGYVEEAPETAPQPVETPAPDQTAQSYGPETIPPPAPSPATEGVGADDNWQGSYGVSGASPQQINPNPEMQGQQQQEMPPVEEQPRTPAEHAANVTNELMTEDKNLKADLDNGHITPLHYSDLFSKNADGSDRSTMGKVGTLFGLMLSGMGSGLSHQPNMLMSMMDNEIKRDLEAQQNSTSNKQNLLRINQQALLNKAQTGVLTEDMKAKALANTYMQENRFNLDNLVRQNNKLPEGSKERMAGDQLLAILSQGVEKKNMSIAAQTGMASALRNMTFGQNGQMNTTAMKSGMLGPEMQKMGEDIETKSIPGFAGQATASLQPGEKAELRSGAVFDSAIKDLISWTKSHPKGAIPGTPEDQMGRAVAGIVQGKLREATNGGVYKSGEQDFINKLIPEDPTKAFNTYRVLPRIQAVQKEMASQTDAKAKSYGLKGYSGMQGSQQDTQHQAISKSGRPIVYKNGKAYYK